MSPARRRLLVRLGVALAVIPLAAVLAALLAPTAAAVQDCSDTYTGTVTTGDWATASNWSAGHVPTVNDVACWGDSQTLVVSVPGAIAGLIQGGGLTISGGSLGLGPDDVNQSTLTGLTITDGSLNGADGDTLSLAGDFDWNVPNGSTSAINPQGALAITQTGSHSFRIRGSGTESITAGSLTTSNPVQISNTNLSPSNFPGPTLSTTSTVTFATGSYAGVDLAISAAGVVTSGAVTTQYSLDLTGSSSSIGGDLSLAALSVDAGKTLTIPSGDTVSAGGGTISGTVGGAGALTQKSGPTEIASGGSVTPAKVAVVSGSLTLDSGGTYTATGGTTISGGFLVLDDDASTGGLTMTGGTINGSSTSTFTVAGDFDWNVPGGGDSGIDTSGPGAVTITQTGSHSFQIRGSGTESISGGALTTPNPVQISNTNFNPNNFPGPSLTTTSTVTFTAAGTYPGGNLTLTAAGVTLATGATTLHDTIDLTGGSTQVASGSALTADHVNESGGTLQVDGTLTAPVAVSGGALGGAGTITGPVTNSGGTVAPGDSPGTLTVSGNYTQGSGGTLAEEIAGATQFDQLHVGGTLSLDGTLAIDSHAFVPSGSNTFKIVSGATSRTGAFAQVTGASAGGATYLPQYDSDGVTLTVDAPPPVNTSPPSIDGTPITGRTVICENGVWTNNPTGFAYEWRLGDHVLSDATTQTITVPPPDLDDVATGLPDEDDFLTCTVTALNGSEASDPAASAPVSMLAPPPPQAPHNTHAPAIAGTPTPPHALTCLTGSWTRAPFKFAFGWRRDGHAIAGATTQHYTVQVADKAHTLTCTVVATNDAGSSEPIASAGVLVARPGTLHCPRPAGSIGSRHVGPLSLGMTRKRARSTLRSFTVLPNGMDDFCLFAGWDVRAGYPSRKLLAPLRRDVADRLEGRVAIALTDNPFYGLRGVHPGTTLDAARRLVHLPAPLTGASSSWFFVSLAHASGVIQVRDGVVLQVGLADARLTRTRKAQRRLIQSFQL